MTNYSVQGSIKNYMLEDTGGIVGGLPRKWKSAPDHPETMLAYITHEEAALLRRANLHNSPVDKPPGSGYGPNGVPSYNGWGDGTVGGEADADSAASGSGQGSHGTSAAGEVDAADYANANYSDALGWHYTADPAAQAAAANNPVVFTPGIKFVSERKARPSVPLAPHLSKGRVYRYSDGTPAKFTNARNPDATAPPAIPGGGFFSDFRSQDYLNELEAYSKALAAYQRGDPNNFDGKWKDSTGADRTIGDGKGFPASVNSAGIADRSPWGHFNMAGNLLGVGTGVPGAGTAISAGLGLIGGKSPSEVFSDVTPDFIENALPNNQSPAPMRGDIDFDHKNVAGAPHNYWTDTDTDRTDSGKPEVHFSDFVMPYENWQLAADMIKTRDSINDQLEKEAAEAAKQEEIFSERNASTDADLPYDDSYEEIFSERNAPTDADHLSPSGPIPLPEPNRTLGGEVDQEMLKKYGRKGVRPFYKDYKEGGVVVDNRIGYGPDKYERLISLATDPMYDVPDPATVGALVQGVPQPGAAAPSMMYRNPSYANGGVVAPRSPQPAGLAPEGGGAIPMQGMEQEMRRMIQQNPQEIMKMKQLIEVAVQSGDVTPEELNMAIQLATAAAQNPQLWPQLRQFAIQQGLADEQSLPMEYDQALVFSLLLAAKAMQMQGGGSDAPQSQGQPPQTTMAIGGPIPESRNEDGSVAINAHEGEGILHAGVVKAMGTRWLDAQNEKFNQDGTVKEKKSGQASA